MPFEQHEFHPRNNRDRPITSRGLKSYLRGLNLSPEELRDKKILDVGSGSGRFAEEAKKAGIENVYSFDPSLASGAVREKSGERGVTSKAVAGQAEEMPFADESFDLVVNNFSLPMWSESPQAMRQAFAEELRVLRPGGELRLAPVIKIGDEVSAHFTSEGSEEEIFAFRDAWDEMLEQWRQDKDLEIRVVKSKETRKATLVIKKKEQ